MTTQETIEALVRAVRNDELVLNYQPKVCLLTGNVIGGEALVRWTDGDDPVLSPDQFIPLVESRGLLHDLTLQLLDQLVNAIVTLRARPGEETPANRRTLALSINVAPNDLASRLISDRIHELLSSDRIAAPELQIEITESAVMGNLDLVHDDLLRIKEMGINIMMDDFGTGYSSLDRLSQLPFDALKLDQGMVKRMGASRQSLDVVRSAISMARELGMTSVAEGIESEAVYNFLIAHGCEQGQGYYLARPMSLHDFQGFLAQSHDFAGSQIGRVHQACLNLLRFRKGLLDAAYCLHTGETMALASVVEPELHVEIEHTRLGLWYFGIGQDLIDYPGFRALEAPLRQVHHAGLAFLASLDDGYHTIDLDRKLAVIDEQINHLIRLLHALERSILAGRQD